MAESLGADCLSVDHVTEQHLAQRRLIGLGSGIYWARTDDKILELARKIPSNCQTFLFITSGLRFTTMVNYYKNLLSKTLRKKDVRQVKVWHCPGFDKYPMFKWMGISKSRPDQRDLAEARRFALKMGKQSSPHPA
ncbi:hypothetical protein AAU61_10090 [Desulfocarbo indianensis]|nr:hypothetical protein AAU61_10090 [Desulfocarbo indianensis]